MAKELATRAYSVTAHDSNFQSGAPFRGGVTVLGAGNLAVVTIGGETVTLTGLLANTHVNLVVARVNSTGTTATNIVGFN